MSRSWQNIAWLALVLLLLLLTVLDLCCGSFWLSPWQADGIEQMILRDLRLPKALAAILAGVGLSVAGMQMQTLFRNPLAGPYILGVSGGAGLGVALLTLGAGWIGWTVSGFGLAMSALIGSALVLMLVLVVSRFVRNNVSLLIVGMMLGSMAGALVNLLQNFANPESLKLFVVWTFGSLSAVGWQEMPWLFALWLTGMVLAVGLLKPMNGLTLGENYARGLGMDVKKVRLLTVLSTCLLAGSVTAWCGPIAFIGVAVPHLARGLFRSANHRIVLPASALIGADMLLLCDILSNLTTYPLPISTVSALFGAPVVIYVILRR